MRKVIVILLFYLIFFVFVINFVYGDSNIKMLKTPHNLLLHISTEDEIEKYQTSIDKILEIRYNKYSEKEIKLLTQVVHAEAGSKWIESEHQILVATVVLNRVESKYYPNSIEEVIYQKSQYACVNGPQWNITPDSRTVENTIRALYLFEENHYSRDILFQAEFLQGSDVYKEFEHKVGNSQTYFCIFKGGSMYNQELYPGASIYEAMEVWSLPKNKKHLLKEVSESGKYFAQIKKDGNWYELVKSKTGEIYLFSRGVSVKTNLPVESIKNVPHLKEIFKDIPNDTVIVGEIFYPGKDTNSVRSIMGCLPPKAITRQKEFGKIHFYLFDILRLDGEELIDKSSWERYSILKNFYHKHFGEDTKTEFLELSESIEKDIYNFISDSLRNGEEGVVLKLKTHTYSEGKRPAWSMIKVKKEDNVDVICMGFEEPTKEYSGTELENWEYWYDNKELQPLKGNYYDLSLKNNEIIAVTKAYFYGWKNSIKIGAYKDDKLLQIGTVSSGLTDAHRAVFAGEPEKFINKVIECNCMERTEGSLRHPIFIRFREDKNAKSCNFKNIFQ